MSEHADTIDSIALLALGVLPEAEARAVAEHAKDCAECRAEYAELRTAADALGYDAELGSSFAGADAARLKSRVMDAVRASSAAPPRASTAAKVIALPDRAAAARDRRLWFAYAAAAAALLFAIVTGANDVAVRQRLAANATRDTQLADVVAPGSKHFSVPQGEVVTSGGHVYLALRGLAEPPAGKVYQAWTLQRGEKAVAPSITFSPDPSGVTIVELPEPATNLAAVALSVEPAGGSKAPTSKPAFIRPLS
jgi:hypothetical protein